MDALLARNLRASEDARGVVLRRILIVLLFALSETAPIVLAHPDLASAATYTIAINGAPNCGTSMFCYSPSSLTVTAGDTVTWVNNSTVPHTVTTCDPSACPGNGPGRGGRQSGPSSPAINASGGSFTFTFTRPGKYKYYSAIHGHAMLHGKITVVAATNTTVATGSTAPTPVPPTSATIVATHAAATRQSSGAFTYTIAIDGTPNCGTSMFCYNPSSLAVNAGDTVTWVNNSTAPHTVTRCDPSTCSGNGPGNGGQSGPSSPTINAAGGTYSFTFTSPGTYNYFCAIYGSAMMQGAITVDQATTATAAGFSSTATTATATATATGVLSATSGPSSSSPGAVSTPASGSQLAGTRAPKSQGGTVGLVLLLLGLGLAAAFTARRRPNAERPSVAAPPESSLTFRLLEDREAEGSMQDPTRKWHAKRLSRRRMG